MRQESLQIIFRILELGRTRSPAVD